MRVWRIFFTLLCKLITLVAGVSLIAFSFFQSTFQTWIITFAQSAAVEKDPYALWTCRSIGLSLILIAVLALLAGVRKRQPAKWYVPMKTEHGEIRILSSAIASYIAKSCQRIEGVKRIVPEVVSVGGGKGVAINARVDLVGGQSIKWTGETIRRHISESLKEMLGIEEVEQINVTINEITVGDKKQPVIEVEPEVETETSGEDV